MNLNSEHEKWPLWRGGCSREVAVSGGSTIYKDRKQNLRVYYTVVSWFRSLLNLSIPVLKQSLNKTAINKSMTRKQCGGTINLIQWCLQLIACILPCRVNYQV